MKLIKALAATIALIAILAGIPLGLITFYGNPFPTALPTGEQIAHALTSNDTIGLFLFVLVWIGWIAWATFALSIVLEIFARLRRMPTPQIKGLGVQQGAAALLIAAIAGGISAPAMAATPDTAPAAITIQHTAPDTTPATEAATTAHDTATTIAKTTPDQPRGYEVTVQPGDSAWSIAERHLGDGARWKELAEANYDRPQPGGGSLVRGEDPYLEAGWTLVIPGSEDMSPDEIAAREAADKSDRYTTITADSDDTIRSLAEEHLGDSDRWPEIYAASTDFTQPDGDRMDTPEEAAELSEGWTVRIPTDAPLTATANTAAPAEETTPQPDKAPAPTPNAAPAAAQAFDISTGLSKLVKEQNAAAAATTPEAQTPAPATAPSEKHNHAEDQIQVPWAGIGSILAASILGTLLVRRRDTFRRRRAGYTMPKAATIAALDELRLTRIEDATALEFIDRALRTLSALHMRSDESVPDVRLARLTNTHLELYAATAHKLPAPFEATDDPATWLLPRTAPLATDEDLEDVAAPYPALVTIGSDDDGNQILVDLEHLAALGIHAATKHSTPVMRAITLSLATSQWADDLAITTVGVCPELEGHLGSGRITYADTVSELLDDLEDKLHKDQQTLEELGHTSAQKARSDANAEDIWAPQIIVIGTTMTLSEQSRLQKIVDAQPQIAVAVISSDDHTDLSDWRLHIESLESARLEPLGLPLHPQHLEDDDYARVLSALDISVATEPTEFAEEELPHEAPQLHAVGSVRATERTILLTDEQRASDPAPISKHPHVCILGPITLEGATDAIEPNKKKRLTEIAAYIHFNPGTRDTDFAADLWPGKGAGQNTRQTAISKLRRWLGATNDGEQYLPRASGSDGSYTFTEHITSDYETVKALAERRKDATDIELANGLKLVRGIPFQDAPRNRYSWATYVHSWALTHVVDIAHELATRALNTGDTDTALWATQQGLIVEPLAEVLWRDRLTAAADDPETHERETRALYARTTAEDYELSPETEALAHTPHTSTHRIAS